MEQTALAFVEDKPDVLKARLRREWEVIAARKEANNLDDGVHRARVLTTYTGLGLTQCQIAGCVGIGQQRVGQLLRYGRFLVLLTTPVVKTSETRFRSYWAETADHAHIATLRGKKNESARLEYEQHVFQEIVEKYMKGAQEPTKQPQGKRRTTQQIAKQILAQFCDAKFHLLRDIATAVEADMTVVGGICERIVKKGTHQTFGERRPAAPAQGSFAYRFVKGGKKKIDLSAFYAEVKPVLDDMETVINGHRVDFSQETLRIRFAQFRKVIESVAR